MKTEINTIKEIHILQPNTENTITVIATSPCIAIQKVKRLVVLNAPVVKPNSIMAVNEINFETAKELIYSAILHDKPILSFIGHESTAKFLSQYFRVEIHFNRGMYQPQENELALVFRLKRRLEKPQEVVDLKPEDFQVLAIHYL